jgi:uncharacterized protein involved in type VI secretion and phage assembly
MPEVGDEVLIAFELGDVRRPYVLGGLYNGVDKPPKSPSGAELVKNGAAQHRIMRSPGGHRLVLDDDNKPFILVESGDAKLAIKLDQDQTAISVNSEKLVQVNGKSKVTIEGNEIVVEAKQTLELKAQTLKLSAQQSLEMTSSQQMKIDGGMQLDVKGGMIKLN